LLACLWGAGCGSREPPAAVYFGQPPPGETPVVFAPGVISREDRFEQFLLYLPGGKDLAYGVTNGDWSEFSLYTMSMEGGAWSPPVPAPFLGDDPEALTATIALDRRQAFFTAARPSYPPADIWTCRRGDAGWSEPRKLGPPISSGGDEFEVAVARDGTLYFSSSREGGEGDLDIYRARPVGGEYPEAENLGPPINTSAGDDLPYIAPDQSYLIFASDRPGGAGNRDLYVSFREDGSWTEPVGLGPRINTEAWEIYPSVSPDGRYLFFTRRVAWETAEDSDVYWVRATFLDRPPSGG
jgi:hypothetical protein